MNRCKRPEGSPSFITSSFPVVCLRTMDVVHTDWTFLTCKSCLVGEESFGASYRKNIRSIFIQGIRRTLSPLLYLTDFDLDSLIYNSNWVSLYSKVKCSPVFSVTAMVGASSGR